MEKRRFKNTELNFSELRESWKLPTMDSKLQYEALTLNGLSVPGMIGSLASIRNRVTLSESSYSRKITTDPMSKRCKAVDDYKKNFRNRPEYLGQVYPIHRSWLHQS